MTAEQQTNDSTGPNKQSNLCIWLVALGAALLYFLTLNHWVTLSSLPIVAKITGWDWHPTYLDWRQSSFAPLFYLVSYPFRWLPAAWQPVGLNALSAVFAVLTLSLLARSVRLLPHDRTRHQRVRELEEYAGLLLPKDALLPQLLAVVLCGLQISFWENAITATGEMLDLLVFAYLIRCLLEFRVSRAESWLTRFVLVYGIGTTNNWALIGFFPLFLISLIWMKGFGFFKWRYIGRLALLGLAGLSLYLLLPIVGSVAGEGSFGHLLRQELAQQKMILTAIPRWVPGLLSFPTILALLFIGIRWPSFQGDMSAIGSSLSNFAFHLMHLLFLGAGIWIFFDFKYSPRALEPRLPFLTFYYMAALSVGYFFGYLYMVFGKTPVNVRQRISPLQTFISKAVVVLLLLLVGGVTARLIIANVPKVQALNSPVLSQYAAEMAKSLPARDAIVLSDDPTRLLLLNAAYLQMGKQTENLLIETKSLSSLDYLRYLYERHPQLRTYIPPLNKLPAVVDPMITLHMLEQFNKKGNIPVYYLHPSFGFFFERFYAKPIGLVYELKPYIGDALEAPALTVSEVNANQEFWARMQTQTLATVSAIATNSLDAASIAWYCSRSLNYWGVELQKANRLKEASERFSQSLNLNPRNHMAEINRLFNANLREGNTQAINTADLIREAMNEYRTWEGVMTADGPADEPDLHLRFGQAFAAGNNLRQAYTLFQRRLVLRPNDFEALLGLAKTYADMGFSEKATAMVRQAEPFAATPANQAEVLRVETLICVLKNDFAGAEKLLLAARKQRPDDEKRVSLLVEFYRMAGLNQLRANQVEKANEQFKAALACTGDLLEIIKNIGRNGSPEEADVLLKRAQLQIQLLQYDGAIATLNTLLQRQPENAAGLMNRAIAQLQSKKYPGAKRDYQALLKVLPTKVYAVYYGLAEIAYQEKDKPTAIKNCKLYLKLAPPNSPEYKQVADRLAELQRGS